MIEYKREVVLPLLEGKEEPQEFFSRIERSLFQPPIDFFISIKNQNFRDLGLLQGDYLAVHRTQNAQKGQIVVLKMDNELILKRFSENELYQNLEGIGVGIIRPLIIPSLS